MDIDTLVKSAKGLIFDCDGTLVDSMPLHLQGWRYAFEKFNVMYDEAYLDSLKGMKEADVIRAYNVKFNLNLDPDKMVAEKHIFISENIETIKPVVPIVEIAKAQYGKLPLAVVSGSLADMVEKELQVVGIHHLFDTIITGSDPFQPKPHPECFLEAARRIQIEPNNIVVFEDGDTGIEAAQKAGMKTVDVRHVLI